MRRPLSFRSGNVQLNASVDVDLLSISGNGIANTIALNSPTGTIAYTPAQIRSAYGINNMALDGTGQTIAIVDAYDDPGIFQALDAFDSSSDSLPRDRRSTASTGRPRRS